MKSYVKGSDGYRNLFFRPAGIVVTIAGLEYTRTQKTDAWIVQWEGAPDYSSGYAEHEFASEKEAIEYFENCPN